MNTIKARCTNLYNKINGADVALTRVEKEILDYLQLDPVLTVEEFVRQHSGEFKKR